MALKRCKAYPLILGVANIPSPERGRRLITKARCSSMLPTAVKLPLRLAASLSDRSRKPISRIAEATAPLDRPAELNLKQTLCHLPFRGTSRCHMTSQAREEVFLHTLELLDQYLSLRNQLQASLKAGYFGLAQARYSLGASKVGDL